MASIQERLHLKRIPIDKWSVKEQLCLASAVVRNGNQNWMSVSRSIKSLAEPNRPPDWFSQKNCAAQYGLLLEKVETPKRKKRVSGSSVETVVETAGDSILRRLTEERISELRKLMELEKNEYFKLKAEMDVINSGKLGDGAVLQMHDEILEEDRKKERDVVAHAQWLKEREEKKLEVERLLRPGRAVVRKVPEAAEAEPEPAAEPQEAAKPSISPLLTSLLKSPSPAQNITSSILHTAITGQRSSSPTIASLLNSGTAGAAVSSSLQQLVTSAIGQPEPEKNPPEELPVDEASFKVDEIESLLLAEEEAAGKTSTVHDLGEVIEQIDNLEEIPEPADDVLLDCLQKSEESLEKFHEELQREEEAEPPREAVEAPKPPKPSKPPVEEEARPDSEAARLAEPPKPVVPEAVVVLEQLVLDVEPAKEAPAPEPGFLDDPHEVTKIEKPKVKRDYSRTKKKEEKDLEMLLAAEKIASEIEVLEPEDKMEEKMAKCERSGTPWSEEEELQQMTRARRRLSTPIDSVPSSPASSVANPDDERDYRAWKKSILLLYNRLATHKYASLFLKPITEDQAPDYHQLVYRPIDLSTIKRAIETGSVRTTAEFQRDVLVMFNNAVMYNESGSHVYRMALEMQREGLEQIKVLLRAQTETMNRRETRTSEAAGAGKRKRHDEASRSAKKM